MISIYLITNSKNGKVYIGQTQDISARWSCHKSEANANRLQYPLYRAMRKYGLNVFSIIVLEVAKSLEDADSLEKKYINMYDSRNPKIGYNLTAGGLVARGWHHSEESKKKISDSQKGKIVIVSEETKKKISATNMGRNVSVDTKKKISKAITGIKRSKETKDKISSSKLGKKASIETKNKMSDIQKNRQKVNKSMNLAKLDFQLVEQIKKDWSTGLLSQRQIAKKYNVNRMTIWRVVNNITWKSIETLPISSVLEAI